MGFNDVMVVRDIDRAKAFKKYLMPNEQSVLAVRRHPASLLRYVLEVFGGLILAGFVSEWLGPGLGMTVVWLAWLFLLGRLLWKVVTWSIEYFIVTEHRLLYIRGLIDRRIGMIPLKKVTDINLERPLQGRLLDYGTFIMESAGQDQAFRNVTFMPYPEQLYFEVSTMIFGLEDPGDD
ncbi:PH domain-containing protein [Actinocorallia longicatena]|uniref:YdbS-like PH domain-containing protein n=1 Tax=Actinocorallia longicatena TaxID=111803 RepID=A0ABP6Q1C2_9ACTN